VKKIIQIDVESLGKMLATYCVSQGWAEEIEGNRIILNNNGIRKLSGPPYFFDLSDSEPEFDELPSELENATSTFTWHQKNFTPGKTKAPSRAKPSSQPHGDIHNWKPGQLGNNQKIGFGSWQSKPSPQRKQHTGKKSHSSSPPGTIKMRTKLPPIARTNSHRNKKRKK
jgi:hypothetical protein